MEKDYNLNTRIEKIEKGSTEMDTESYFGMIINILLGLTFIVLVFAFLYLIYGEREETSKSTSKSDFLRNTISRMEKLSFVFIQFATSILPV